MILFFYKITMVWKEQVVELPFCRNSNHIKWQNPLFALLAIAFYLPSYLHDRISVSCRSAGFGKSDRNIYRLTTSPCKVIRRSKFFFCRICRMHTLTRYCDVQLPHTHRHPSIASSPTPSPNGRVWHNPPGKWCCTMLQDCKPLFCLFFIPTKEALRCSRLKPHLLPTAPV